MIELSAVVITYNRSNLLVESVRRLRYALEVLPYSCEIIIADDGSSSEHQAVISSIPSVRVVRNIQNKGMGANVNNGLAHARGAFVLQVQDDWNCVNPSGIKDSLDFLVKNPDVGIVQMTHVGSDLPAELRRCIDSAFLVFANDGLPWIRRSSVRPYSDNPHIKRREFVVSLGPYIEGVPMTFCENEYKKRVSGQSDWRVAMLQTSSVFVHAGAEESHNPGGRRHPLVQIMHKLPFGKRFIEPTFRRIAQAVDHGLAKLSMFRTSTK